MSLQQTILLFSQEVWTKLGLYGHPELGRKHICHHYIDRDTTEHF